LPRSGIEHDISDRVADLLRQGECGARDARGIAEHPQIYFVPIGAMRMAQMP